MDNKKNSKDQKVEDKLNSFIGKYSKAFIAIAVVLIVVIIGLCVALVTIQNRTNSRFDAMTALEGEYNTLLQMDPESAEYADETAAFIASCNELVSSAGIDTYPGAKAMYLLAELAYADQDYQAAADYYAQIAAAQSGTYLAPLCIMNQAACYENLQDNATALELYRSVLDTYGDNSAYAPKAMFSIGRIYDAQGETALAQAEFETLTGLYLVPEKGGTPSEYARMAEAYLINYAD